MGMEIQKVTSVDDVLIEAIAELLPQLSPKSCIPTRDEIQAVVDSPATMLFVARENGADDKPGAGKIVGALTLVRYWLLTGLKVWIEDVVVDSAARGKGVGEALTRAAMEQARSEGATAIDLTSRPEREAANRLYQRMGFERRETNVYRYSFKD